MLVFVFSALSVVAIAAGGLTTAFSSRQPTRMRSWASAYLVLVLGIIQLALVSTWRWLGQPDGAVTLASLLVYNIGNAAVIFATVKKSRLRYSQPLVRLGGILIGVAMVLLLFAVRNAKFSLPLVELIVLAVIILVSIPPGVIMSARRYKELRREQ